MVVKWLGDGQGFSFPSSFGFSRSASKTAARMPDDNRAEAVQVRPGTEFTPRDPKSMDINDRTYQQWATGQVAREPFARGGPVHKAAGGLPGPSPAPSARPLTRKLTPAPMPGNALAKGALYQHRGRHIPSPMPTPGAAASAPAAMPPPPMPDMQAMPMAQPQGLKKGGKIHIKKSHEGLLHKNLGVPADKPIPTARLNAAKNSPDPAVRKRATFAANAKRWK